MTSHGAIPLRTIRAALRSAVQGTSLRKTAARVGLSAPGLMNIINGNEPREITYKKLVAWYIQNGAESVEVSPEVANAVLTLLLDRIPAGQMRERARAAVLREVRAAHRKASVHPPGWLAALADE